MLFRKTGQDKIAWRPFAFPARRGTSSTTPGMGMDIEAFGHWLLPQRALGKKSCVLSRSEFQSRRCEHTSGCVAYLQRLCSVPSFGQGWCYRDERPPFQGSNVGIAPQGIAALCPVLSHKAPSGQKTAYHPEGVPMAKRSLVDPPGGTVETQTKFLRFPLRRIQAGRRSTQRLFSLCA